jgi:hypothetical protein
VTTFDGSVSLTFGRSDSFMHAALPGFSIDVASLFDEA